MADTTQTPTTAPERAAAPGRRSTAPADPVPSLDEMLEKELGQDPDEERPAPKARAKRQAPRDEDEEDEDEEIYDDADEDEDSDEEDPADEDEDEEINADEDDDSEDEEEEQDDSEDDESEDEDTDDDEEDPADDKKAGKAKSKTDDEPAPKGLEDLPKWAQKRIRKQSEDLREFKARLAERAIRTEPTPANPLGHVTNAEELGKVIAQAKATRNRLRSIKDSDYTEVEGKDASEATVEIQGSNGQLFRLTRAQVEARLEAAESVLDPEVVAARQQFIATRNQLKPWEQAEAIAPDIHKEGSPANRVLTTLLANKDLNLRALPDFELFAAHAARSLQQELDSRPSKKFPKGRAKWVRYELDAKGKVISPKRAGKKGESEQTRPKLRAPSAPRSERPVSRPGSSNAGGRHKAPDKASAAQRYAQSGSEADLDALLAAELG